MRQKLSQYSGLVDVAERQTGPTKVTLGDLQVKKAPHSSIYTLKCSVYIFS